MPKKLVFRSENLYFDAVKPAIKKYEKESLKKEGRKKNDKNAGNIFKQDKEKFVIPRSVQQVIPIEN